MARVLDVQSTFSSGEADPRLAERRDVQFYYSAVARGRNVVALPQGGFASTPGLRAEGMLRNPLTFRNITGISATAPNGGNAADATDGSIATDLVTNAVSGATFVVLELDFGSQTTFCAADLVDFKAASIPVDLCLAVEWSADSAAWQPMNTVAPTVDVATSRRSRRFATVPGTSVTARFIRVVIYGGAGMGAFTLNNIRVLQEAVYTGVVRTVNFAFSKGQEYTIALTPNNGDVFYEGVWQAAFGIGLTAAMLPQIEWAQRLDSFIVWHEDLTTPLIKRQGRHTEWDYRSFPFTNVPLYDYGAVYSNGVNAKQRVQLFNIAVGEAFDLTVEGQTTTQIVLNNTAGATAANIQAALEALPNVDAGLLIVPVSQTVFDVTFSGGANAGREWQTMAGTAHDTDGIVTVREIVRGRPAGENAYSTQRGWARTGVFFQQSLVMGGFKSLPLHILKSVTGAPDNGNTGIATANGAFFFELDASTANEIFKIYAGPKLLAFTADGAFFLEGDKLDKTEVPHWASTQQPGIRRGIPVAQLEGGVVYIEHSGQIVRELNYNDVRQNFSALNISVLSAHLLSDPCDLAHRRAVAKQENDLVMIVNRGDGTLIFMTALRSENITGFTLRDTRGQFKAISANTDQIVRVAVSRTTNGVARLWLERFDQSCITDCAHVATGGGITSIALPPSLNGETLHVFCDKGYVGTRTVANGAISGLPACSRIEAGFAVLADVVDMPVLKEEEARQPLARLKRCFGLALSLYETDHVAVEVNNGPTYPVPLTEIGKLKVGQSIGDVPFTGTVHLEGFLGFTEGGQVRIRQLRPGRLNVRQLRKSLRV
jgi:hypothetical protein